MYKMIHFYLDSISSSISAISITVDLDIINSTTIYWILTYS